MIDGVHFIGEHPSFLENMEKTEAIDHEFVLKEKAKFLRACSDIAILTEMTRREAVSALDVIILFEKNCDIRVSPGTLYPILYRLERRGYITELPKRRKKFYVLTDSGRKVLEDIEQSLREIQFFIICLLDKRVSQHDYQI